MHIRNKVRKLVIAMLGEAQYLTLVARIYASHTTYFRDSSGTLLAKDRTGAIYFSSSKRAGRYRAGIAAKFDSVFFKYVPASMSFGQDDVIIDVGASVGEFAVPAAQCAQTVFALEPEPAAFLALKKNATIADGRIVPIQVAASDVSQEMVFYFSADTSDSSAIRPGHFTHASKIKAICLRDFVERHRIDVESLALIKIEAEGYEPEVLRGLLPDIRPRYVSVNCDPEREGQSPLAEVIDLLSRSGYDVTVSGFMVYGSIE